MAVQTAGKKAGLAFQAQAPMLHYSAGYKLAADPGVGVPGRIVGRIVQAAGAVLPLSGRGGLKDWAGAKLHW